MNIPIDPIDTIGNNLKNLLRTVENPTLKQTVESLYAITNQLTEI